MEVGAVEAPKIDCKAPENGKGDMGWLPSECFFDWGRPPLSMYSRPFLSLPLGPLSRKEKMASLAGPPFPPRPCGPGHVYSHLPNEDQLPQHQTDCGRLMAQKPRGLLFLSLPLPSSFFFAPCSFGSEVTPLCLCGHSSIYARCCFKATSQIYNIGEDSGGGGGEGREQSRKKNRSQNCLLNEEIFSL